MTRSGLAARIWAESAVHESATIVRPSPMPGQTSSQKRVQATMRSVAPMATRIWVTLGWSETMRWGACSCIRVYCRSTSVSGTHRSMFSAKLLDHFEHPRNTAEIDAPDAGAEVENPVCGDVLRITLRLE